MKTLAIIALSLISLKTTAQTNVLPVDSLTRKITFTEWVKVDGASADEIYNRAVLWFTRRNDSMENIFPVIKDKGKITSMSYTWLTVMPPAGTHYSPRELTRKMFYTITIQVKDGGYRFTMSDFYFHYFAKSIFASDKDSTLESVADRKQHDTLTQRFLYQVRSTAKYFSASLKSFIELATPNGPAKGAVSDNMDARITAAGDELIKAGNLYYKGLGMTIGGSLVDVIAIDALRTVPVALPVLGVAGGVLIIVGAVDMIVSYNHIRRAGQILKYGTKSQWEFGLTHTGGVGLCLTF